MDGMIAHSVLSIAVIFSLIHQYANGETHGVGITQLRPLMQLASCLSGQDGFQIAQPVISGCCQACLPGFRSTQGWVWEHRLVCDYSSPSDALLPSPQVTSKFELYTCLSPLVTKAGAILVVTKLLRWVRKEEDRLFIRYPPKYSTPPSTTDQAPNNGLFTGL